MTSVLIYTTHSCPWCKKTKEFFKKYNIKYTEKDVAKDEKTAQEAMDKSGQIGVPVIDVDGQIIVGFDESKLKKALKIK